MSNLVEAQTAAMRSQPQLQQPQPQPSPTQQPPMPSGSSLVAAALPGLFHAGLQPLPNSAQEDVPGSIVP